MQGCAGCPVGPGSSCSHWAPLGASLAPGSCRECCAWIQEDIAKENTGYSQYFHDVRENTLSLYSLIYTELQWYNGSEPQPISKKCFLRCARIHRRRLKAPTPTVRSYPRVPRPAMGGLGGFCVGGLVLESVPPRPAALFPCC